MSGGSAAVVQPPRVKIPPTRFELVSPDPKSCMIDHYTTGVTEMNLRLIPAVSTLIFYAL